MTLAQVVRKRGFSALLLCFHMVALEVALGMWMLIKKSHWLTIMEHRGCILPSGRVCSRQIVLSCNPFMIDGR